jgi:hypothetical protein
MAAQADAAQRSQARPRIRSLARGRFRSPGLTRRRSQGALSCQCPARLEAPRRRCGPAALGQGRGRSDRAPARDLAAQHGPVEAPRPQERLHLPALRRAQRVHPEDVRRSSHTPAHSRPIQEYAGDTSSALLKIASEFSASGRGSLDGIGPASNRSAAERLRSRMAPAQDQRRPWPPRTGRYAPR